MNDEPFEISKKPKHVAEKLGIDPQFPSVSGGFSAKVLDKSWNMLRVYKRGTFIRLSLLPLIKSLMKNELYQALRTL